MTSTPPRVHAMRGISLIELMVSLVIGLIIVLAAVSAYIGAAGAGRVAEAQGRMNEDAQMALTILTENFRMAGSNPARPNRAPVSLHNPLSNPFVVRGCDVQFSNAAGTTPAANTAALNCAHTATSTGPDAISISYEADVFNTLPTSTNNPTDCTGGSTKSSTQTITADNGTTANITVYEAENRFYVGTSTTILTPSLWCKGNGSSAQQPLVENVEDLQILYGTSNPAITPTAVIGYMNAYQLENDATTLGALSLVQKWSAVSTVRICILIRSNDNLASNAASAQYYDCNGNLVTNPPDLRLRKAYSTTVVLRNMQ